MMYSRVFIVIFSVLWLLWTILQIQFDFPPRYNLRAFNLYSAAALFIVAFLPDRFFQNFFVKSISLAVVMFIEIQLLEKCINNINRLIYVLSGAGVDLRPRYLVMAEHGLSLTIAVALGFGLAVSVMRLLFAQKMKSPIKRGAGP